MLSPVSPLNAASLWGSAYALHLARGKKILSTSGIFSCYTSASLFPRVFLQRGAEQSEKSCASRLTLFVEKSAPLLPPIKVLHNAHQIPLPTGEADIGQYSQILLLLPH